MTIARIWRVVTLAEKSGHYLEYLNKVIVPACQTAEGNEGLFLMKECQGELTHFLLLTLWASDEAVANYTGTAEDVVNPTPEERDLLIAFESTARHYQVVKLETYREKCGYPDQDRQIHTRYPS